MATTKITPPPEGAPPEEVDAYREAMAEANMQADGVATVTKIPVDYFGCDDTVREFLPDGVSFVELKIFTEGDRRKYLDKTNRDVTVKKTSGDAVMRLAPGAERYQLLRIAIVGWNLMRGGTPVAFSPNNLDLFLDSTNPTIVDKIEKAVRAANPWLEPELTVEEIDNGIKTLQELREKRIAEDEGKDSSSTR